MSYSQNNSVLEPPPAQVRRRRWVPWVLGGVVLLLLSVLASQQLWLWNVIQPDTASDTLVLYGLSTLNFVASVPEIEYDHVPTESGSVAAIV